MGPDDGVFFLAKDRTNLCQLIRSGGGEVAEKPGENVVHILPHTAPRHATRSLFLVAVLHVHRFIAGDCFKPEFYP